MTMKQVCKVPFERKSDKAKELRFQSGQRQETWLKCYESLNYSGCADANNKTNVGSQLSHNHHTAHSPCCEMVHIQDLKSAPFHPVNHLFVDKEAEEEERKQRVLLIKQTIYQTQDAVAGSLASGLNALLQYVSPLLQATGVQVSLYTVTTEGVIFVCHWALLLLICYGVMALAFLLVTVFLRWLWWFLKVVVALACFGLILNDHSVSKEILVIRLVSLGSVCMFLSIMPWKDGTMAAKIIHLQEQMKILENRAREKERCRRRLATLSWCLIGLLCFVFFVVFIIYRIISNKAT
ncbi:uncharacterized protein [Pempheris klunzingeri]|uniref:uncharacterized protein n=1 Tax=Pempheris klunzingeri TaxID=3127111 RepID=UPI00398142D4